jgi:hypothetical protein
LIKVFKNLENLRMINMRSHMVSASQTHMVSASQKHWSNCHAIATDVPKPQVKN